MSKEVKRYNFDVDKFGSPRAYESEHGRWMNRADYEALLAERDALKKDAERYRWMRAVVIAEREGCTEELYDSECDRLLEAYDAALQGDQP